jgi:uncharacterized protein YjfI (DUF2170 family)
MKNLICFFIITLATCQTNFGQIVYPVSETDDISASCKSCKINNPSNSVGIDMNDYSSLKVVGSSKNISYVYENLLFPVNASAGTEVNFVISNDKMGILSKTDIQNVKFYSLLNNVSNKDSITGDNAIMAPIGNSGKYLVTFTTKNIFNEIGIQMNIKDNKDEEKDLRLYGVYYNIISLPVELLSFTGKNEISGNTLEWITLSEENNSGFIIEKSADGINFTEVDKVEGQGTTENVTEYSFTDVATRGFIYYRLKQINFNGTITYSQIISVNSNASEGLTMMGANPFEDSVIFSFITTGSVSSSIEMTDINGEIVYQQSGMSIEGYNQVSLERLGGFKTGVYTLTVIAGNKTMHTKIVK